MNKVLFITLGILINLAASAQSTLYYNGKIYTSDPASPLISFFVVEQGVITQTGNDVSTLEMNRFTNKIDLQGKTVLPGIIDSHIHFIDGGLGLLQASFFRVQTREELVVTIHRTKNQLIDGMYIGRDLGYEPLKEESMPIHLLDTLLPNTPAILFLKSGHAAIVNHAALKKLGFTKATKIPDGTIQMKNGEFTGLLLEGAAMEASRLISSSYSNETIQKAILKIQARALSYGITTIGDNTFNPYHFKIYQELQKNEQLKIRVRARSYGRVPQTESLMLGVGKKHLGFIGGGVDPARVKYHAMKFFEDQSLSMAVHADDHVIPGGKVFLDEKQLTEIFENNPQSTFAFHVQGKEGAQHILDAVRQHPSQRRHILDHAGYVSAQQMQEASDLQLGVTILAGQLFDYPGIVSLYKNHSPNGFLFNENELLNARVKYQVARGALTSDYPYGMDTLFANYPQIDGLNPFPMMAVNASGKFPDGNDIKGVGEKTITRDEAVNAFTTHGAYVLGEEKTLGKIATGYRADFVLLQQDILAGEATDLYTTKVLATYINGERVFESGEELTQPAKRIKVSPTDYAISPVIGYDPTVGMILGGAYFKFPLKTPGRYFDVQLQTISGGKLNTQINFVHYDLFKNVNFNFSSSYSDFFQYYFGEGNRTDANNYQKLYANNYRLKPELALKFNHHYQLSSFIDLRGRHETLTTDKNGVDQNKTLFPDENTVAIGFTFQQDTRDNVFSSRRGMLKQIGVQYIPSSWNVRGSGDVAQLSMDVRHFRKLGKSNIVLASHLAAGYSFGSPSYLFRYSLGGAYTLRGFYSNRFRGDKYYAAQVEARFPIYKRFSGVAFFDAGDVTDNDFIKPKYSYGGGIRFALSQNIKLRLDYGMTKDQSGVFFTFSETF